MRRAAADFDIQNEDGLIFLSFFCGRRQGLRGSGSQPEAREDCENWAILEPAEIPDGIDFGSTLPVTALNVSEYGLMKLREAYYFA